MIVPNHDISNIFMADVGKGERPKHDSELVILYYEVRESKQLLRWIWQKKGKRE